MFATTDEAFADMEQTLAGIADGVWVPPLVAWLGNVKDVGLTTVRARLETRRAELLQQWKAKRDAHLAALRQAIVDGYEEGGNDASIAARLGVEPARVRYVRKHLPQPIPGRLYIDWAAKVAGIPQDCAAMAIPGFVEALGTPYQTGYWALRKGRIPGWRLSQRKAVRVEVEP